MLRHHFLWSNPHYEWRKFHLKSQNVHWSNCLIDLLGTSTEKIQCHAIVTPCHHYHNYFLLFHSHLKIILLKNTFKHYFYILSLQWGWYHHSLDMCPVNINEGSSFHTDEILNEEIIFHNLFYILWTQKLCFPKFLNSNEIIIHNIRMRANNQVLYGKLVDCNLENQSVNN